MKSIANQLSIATIAAACLAAPPVFAQAAPAAPAAAAPSPAAPSAQALEDARKHYEAGFAMFDAADYEPALAEFQRAYQFAPNYRIFYNLGKVHRMLKNYVSSLKDFQRFLNEGTDQPADKKTEVAGYIKELSLVVAKVTVSSRVPGADIAVDDVVEGKTPSNEPILVNPGTRKVTVSKAGYVPASKTIQVAPQDGVQVELNPTIPTVAINRTEAGRKKMPAIIPVGWVVTGVFVAGAATFGGLALSEQSQLNTAKQGNLPSNLSSLHSTMVTEATVSDICSAGAIVAGLLSTYFTVQWLTTPFKETTTPVGLNIGPTSMSLSGSF